MRKILLSPHNDDAVLFCGFAICESPSMQVVTVFDSYKQPKNRRLNNSEAEMCSMAARRLEDVKAINEQLGANVVFAGLRDDRNDYTAFEISQAVDIAARKPNWNAVELWLPMHHEGGHVQHNAVAAAFDNSAPVIHRYTTYIRGYGRVRDAGLCGIPGTRAVTPEPEWITRKLRALACYQSQIEIKALGCWPWFMDLQEYIA